MCLQCRRKDAASKFEVQAEVKAWIVEGLSCTKMGTLGRAISCVGNVELMHLGGKSGMNPWNCSQGEGIGKPRY